MQVNALLVALGANGDVAVVDVEGWSLDGTIHLSDTYLPHHLSLSPDGTRVAIGAPASDLSGGYGDGGHSDGGGAVLIIDSRTGDVGPTRPPAEPHTTLRMCRTAAPSSPLSPASGGRYLRDEN